MGFQETRRNGAGKRHSDPLTRALNGNMRAREEFGSTEHALSKQVCPSYGHHRRAGAQESQGKPGEIDQSGQPSQPPEALGPRSEMGRLWLQDSEHNLLGSTDLGLNITSVLNYYYHL